jgi:hypothetical protein
MKAQLHNNMRIEIKSNRLCELFFPRHFKALTKAIEMSCRYMMDSPIKDKRDTGEDIYFRITNILFKK